MNKQDLMTALATAAEMLNAGQDPKQVAADLARLAKDLRKSKAK